MWRVEAILLVVLLFTLLLRRGGSSRGEQDDACPASSCGKISNISYPFRLKDDPERCGDSRYELACENNATTLYLYSGKYEVQSINYKNFTIRVVDPGVVQLQPANYNCSSFPRYSLSPSDFCDTYDYYNNNCTDPYHALADHRIFVSHELLFQHVVYLNCTHPVTNNPKYVDTASCLNWHREGYIYAIASDLMAEDFQVGCHVKLVSPTSWWGLHTNETSYAVIHRALVYGFEISWLHLPCQDLCGDPESCFFDSSREELRCSHYCRSFLGYERIPCGKVKDLTNLLVSYVINCEIFVLPSNCMILRYLSCCN